MPEAVGDWLEPEALELEAPAFEALAFEVLAFEVLDVALLFGLLDEPQAATTSETSTSAKAPANFWRFRATGSEAFDPNVIVFPLLTLQSDKRSISLA